MIHSELGLMAMIEQKVVMKLKADNLVVSIATYQQPLTAGLQQDYWSHHSFARKRQSALDILEARCEPRDRTLTC